ncbi:MAG: sigma-54-dependent Fis family transcriptional regulator, partial [Okeania sp. SIO3B3]|nr:sigma-54-dependent Fis family transcriptional regulator [Okeania sp. SIO3B3]
GGSIEVPINTRIITATNKNLEQFVHEKKFREDLYYRINVLPMHLPSLTDRIKDIPLLIDHFLFQLASKLNKEKQGLSIEAYRKLHHHNWPGNIRELKNVIERASILCPSDRIDADHILFGFELENNMKEMKKLVLKETHENETLEFLMNRYEKEIILEALKSHKSIRKAAKWLNISHSSLIYKMKKLNITLKKELV